MGNTILTESLEHRRKFYAHQLSIKSKVSEGSVIGRTTIETKENLSDTYMAVIIYPISRGMMQS